MTNKDWWDNFVDNFVKAQSSDCIASMEKLIGIVDGEWTYTEMEKWWIMHKIWLNIVSEVWLYISDLRAWCTTNQKNNEDTDIE